MTDAVAERHPAQARKELGGRVLPFPEVDDASIAKILIEGDPRAPRVAWQRFAPMVHRLLKRAFGPRHEVDDLVQEVFLTIFARAHTLREPRAVRAWVISITAHTIRRELRRRAALRWLQFGAPADARATVADLDSREAVARLYAILDRLGGSDRTVFVLRFLEGLDLTDVSLALGVSLATTKRWAARAWRKVVDHARRDDALFAYLDAPRGGEAP